MACGSAQARADWAALKLPGTWVITGPSMGCFLPDRGSSGDIGHRLGSRTSSVVEKRDVLGRQVMKATARERYVPGDLRPIRANSARVSIYVGIQECC
jgi:hypothetical protein